MRPSQNNRPGETRPKETPASPHRYAASGQTRAVRPQNRTAPGGQRSTGKAQSGQQRPVRRARRRPLTPRERAIRYLKMKLAAIPYRLPEAETLARGAICGALILIFALLQTTLFARFRPFGAVPDLCLPLIIALAMTEGEKWGAVCGLIAAFVIESLGSTGVTLLPILYAAAGYFCPIITAQHLTDSVPVRILYTAVSGVGRAIFTLFYLAFTADTFRFFHLCAAVVLPEYAATFCLALLPHLAVHLCLHPFHKSRAERTESL